MRGPWAPLVAAACNLAVAMAVYSLCRLIYLFENWSYFSEGLTTGHWWTLMKGGMVFDASAVMYTCALYLVLVLLPLHVKEREGYYRGCRWLFVVVNAIAVVMNRSDLSMTKENASLLPVPAWMAPSDCSVRQVPATNRL